MLLCEQPGRTGVYATATPERISIYHLGALWPLSHIAASSAAGSLGASSSARRWGPPLAPSFTVPLARLYSGDGDLARRVPMSLSLSCAAYEEMRFFFSDAAGGAWIGAAGGAAQALHERDIGSCGPFGSAYGGHAAVVASGWDPRNAAVLALGRRDGVVQLLDIESGGGGHCRGGGGGGGGPESAVAKVVQERELHCAVTDLDWVPRSHMTVVAARRPDSAGYYAEVMDLRSPESGIRYLGAPRMGATASTATATATTAATAITGAGAGSFVQAPCYAERVACDASQTYVAVVGTHGRRDMVQLWDLRLTSRPVQWHDYPRAGYTSLRWSPCEPMTVVATTRNGRLRLHSFACCEAGVDEEGGSDKGYNEDDEEEKQRGSGFSHPSEMEYDVTSSRSMTASRSHTNGGSWLHARVPAASVAWWSDDRAETKNYASKSSPVAMGQRTDMPCLLLLNAKTGLLHPQVFSRIGSTVVMAGEVALCGAGPNVFLLPHLMEDHTNTNINTNMNTTMSTNIKSNANSDPGTLRGLPGGAVSPIVNSTDSVSGDDLITLNASPFRISADSVSIPHGRFAATRTLPHVEGPQWAVNHLDRTKCRRERLRQGFLPHVLKPLMALTSEGIDSEACALFRYGWLVQRQQHPGRQAMPATDIAPGLIELLQREHPCSQQQKQRYQQDQSPPPPHHQPLGMRELILRAMDWCADRNDDPFPASASPASVLRTSIDNALDLFPTSPITEVEAFDASPPLHPQHHHDPHDHHDPDHHHDHHHHHQPQPQPLDPMDLVGTASRQEAVERRAAILACMGRLHDAAAMLARHSDLHALYPTLALRLSCAASGSAAQGGAVPPERPSTGPGGAGSTHWMDLCLALAESAAPARGALPLSARNEFFAHIMKRFRRFLPLTDQIALAAALLLPKTGALPTKEERAALIQVLHDMLQRQFRPHGSGCSLLLAAAVEGIDRECTSLQRYIDETGDVQTPICYVALYGPAGRGAWRGWNDAYRAQLNAEGDAVLRSLHDLSYIKMIRLRESESMNNINNNTNDSNNNENNNNNNNNNNSGGGAALRQSHGLIGVPFVGFAQGEPVKAKPPNRDGRLSVVLLCGCGQPMHTRAAAIAVNSRPAGCRQMTRCGNPECRLGQTPICVVCCERLDKRGGDGAVENYFAWCTVCLHGGHWAHLRDWFEKHRSCPVEDCPCQCVYDRAN